MSDPHIRTAERRARIGLRHLLAAPATDPLQAAAALVALHATDPATVFLAAWARVRDFDVEHMEEALYDQRSLGRLLGMRRTMFVVPIGLAPTVDAACTRALVGPARRRTVKWIEEAGISSDGAAWLAAAEADTLAELERAGSAFGTELGAAVPELRRKITFGEGKAWGGTMNMTTRVLSLLATEGRVVRGRPRGTWISSQYAWEGVEAWVPGGLRGVEPEDARAELLRRWLRSFGPGTETDMRWWTGWSARDTRAALARLDVVSVTLDEGSGYVLADDLATSPNPGPWIALLPALDSTTMGWKERDWFLSDHAARLFDRNGNAGPTVWASGRVVGGWAQRATGEVVVQFLEDVGRETEGAVFEEAARLTAWLEPIVVKPRFRTPLEKELSA